MKNSSFVKLLSLILLSTSLISCASSMKDGDEDKVLNFFEDFCVNKGKSKCKTTYKFGGSYYSEKPSYSLTPLFNLIRSKYGIIHEAYFKDIWRTGYKTNGRQHHYLLLVGDGYTVIEVQLQWWYYSGYWSGNSEFRFIISYDGKKHSNNERPLTSSILQKGSVNPDTSKINAYLQRVANSKGQRAAESIDVDNIGRARRAREARASRKAIQAGIMSGINKMNQPVTSHSKRSNKRYNRPSGSSTSGESTSQEATSTAANTIPRPKCPAGSNTQGSGIGCIVTGPSLHAKTKADACNHLKNNVAAYKSPPTTFCANFNSAGTPPHTLAVDMSTLRRSPCECGFNGSEWSCIVVQRYSCKKSPSPTPGNSSAPR